MQRYQYGDNMKYQEINSDEISKLSKLVLSEERDCDKCDYKIQRGGTIWRFVNKNTKPFNISFVCCNCSKLV
jgi:hypothetical protein